MSGILAAITACGQAVANFFGWAGKRSDLKNAPDVRQAAVNQAEEAVKDQIETAVANKNLDEIRKLGSE